MKLTTWVRGLFQAEAPEDRPVTRKEVDKVEAAIGARRAERLATRARAKEQEARALVGVGDGEGARRVSREAGSYREEAEEIDSWMRGMGYGGGA